MSTLALIGNSKSGTISGLRVEDSRLHPVAETEVGAGCSTFAIDHERGLVYSATKEPAVVTLRIDPATGTLTELHRRLIDDAAAYLALATPPGGEPILLVSSYHGGWGASFALSDGAVGAEISRFQYRNIHAGIADPAGANAYFASLGDDLIAQFRMTPEGALTPLAEPTVACPPGSGPRHLVLSADERSVYLLTEFTGEAIRFERAADGALTRAESAPGFDPAADLGVSAYGLNPREGHLIWAADLSLTRGEEWLLTTERTESTIGAIRLDGGRLTQELVITPTETQPRGIAVAPDGVHVIALGELSGAAALYRLGDDGHLVQLDRIETGEGPNWVRFV